MTFNTRKALHSFGHTTNSTQNVQKHDHFRFTKTLHFLLLVYCFWLSHFLRTVGLVVSHLAVSENDTKKFSLINDNGKDNGFDALPYFGICIKLNSYNENKN